MSESGGKSVYIVGPLYDHILFIWPPVLFLIIGAAVQYLALTDVPIAYRGGYFELVPALVLTLALGHLFAGLYRTHVNTTILRQFPVRLIAVPIAVLGLMNTSEIFFVGFAVFIVWFDVWHSSQQTFGLGRLYDKKLGNDLEVGRRLDQGMALLIYAGPIVGGVELARHLRRLPWFERVGWNWPTAARLFVLEEATVLTWAMIVVAGLYIPFYIWKYRQYQKAGYQVSRPKVLLYVVLAVVSVWSFGLNSFGQAFLIMESFHALQYFGIVWAIEKKTMRRFFRLEDVPGGKYATLFLFVATSLGFGFWGAVHAKEHFSATVVLLFEGLHYWADGFVWSVRKEQV